MARLNDFCPVCDMKADPDLSSVECDKMYFHFCSTQCRQTFLARPHLYNANARKQQNKIIKRRTIRLSEPLDTEVTDLLIPYLMDMMGVTEVAFEDDKIDITYDLLQVTEHDIEKVLTEVGVQLGGNWLEHLRRSWVHDSEEIALDNLAAPPPPSYNRAPKNN